MNQADCSSNLVKQLPLFSDIEEPPATSTEYAINSDSAIFDGNGQPVMYSGNQTENAKGIARNDVSMAPRSWATGAEESCTTCPMTGGRRQVE